MKNETSLILLLLTGATGGIILGVFLGHYYATQNVKYCEWYLCTYRGTLEYCFGLHVTDCKILEEKCTDSEYLKQWNLECIYQNGKCKCWWYRNESRIKV